MKQRMILFNHLAMQAWESQTAFRTFVDADEKITSLLSKEEIR